MFTKQKHQTVADTQIAQAQKMKSHPKYRELEKHLTHQSELEETEAAFQAEKSVIQTVKASETKLLESKELRLLLAPLSEAETYPPKLEKPEELRQAVRIILRLFEPALKFRAQFLAGRIESVNSEAAPTTAKLLEVRAKVKNIQDEIAKI